MSGDEFLRIELYACHFSNIHSFYFYIICVCVKSAIKKMHEIKFFFKHVMLTHGQISFMNLLSEKEIFFFVIFPVFVSLIRLLFKNSKFF